MKYVKTDMGTKLEIENYFRDALSITEPHWNTERISQFHFRTHFRTISSQFFKQNEQNTQEIFFKNLINVLIFWVIL